jgi:hypothetical protein
MQQCTTAKKYSWVQVASNNPKKIKVAPNLLKRLTEQVSLFHIQTKPHSHSSKQPNEHTTQELQTQKNTAKHVKQPTHKQTCAARNKKHQNATNTNVRKHENKETERRTKSALDQS